MSATKNIKKGREHTLQVMRDNNSEPGNRNLVLTLWLFEKTIDELNNRIEALDDRLSKLEVKQ